MSRKILLKEVFKKLRIVKSYMADSDVVDIPVKLIDFKVSSDWTKTPTMTDSHKNSKFIVSYVDATTIVGTTVADGDILYEKQMHSDAKEIMYVNMGSVYEHISGRTLTVGESILLEAGVIHRFQTLSPTVFTTTFILS